MIDEPRDNVAQAESDLAKATAEYNLWRDKRTEADNHMVSSAGWMKICQDRLDKMTGREVKDE